MPMVVATLLALGVFHPNHSKTTFFANISPNPSITPLTNGRSMFIASDENRAVTRVRVESDESNIARVAEIGAGGESGWLCGGEGVSVRSGKDMDGNDEVREDWTCSHF
jgi:hypothetical protein